MRTTPSVTLDDNLVMVACLDAARDVGRNLGVAIVDDAGGLIAFQRRMARLRP
jgi:uncharacterized protein GlcG (DUF336 family)